MNIIFPWWGASLLWFPLFRCKLSLEAKGLNSATFGINFKLFLPFSHNHYSCCMSRKARQHQSEESESEEDENTDESECQNGTLPFFYTLWDIIILIGGLWGSSCDRSHEAGGLALFWPIGIRIGLPTDWITHRSCLFLITGREGEKERSFCSTWGSDVVVVDEFQMGLQWVNEWWWKLCH